MILRNRIQCKYCGDIIESFFVHDFKQCSCGACAIDGGHEYLKRSFKYSVDDCIELSEWEDENSNDSFQFLHKSECFYTKTFKSRQSFPS